jgi:two-component system, NtrC family, response regulator AtoC
MAKILVVDDELHVRKALQTLLQKEGYTVDEADNAMTARKMLEMAPAMYELILLDLNMPGMSGIEFLQATHKQSPDIPIVIITAFSTAETTMKAMSLGAYDYIAKPFNIQDIKQIVAKALHMHQLANEVKNLRKTVASRYPLDSIIGNSPPMQEVFKVVGKVAASPVTVLIQGESGTGKELIAKSIHYNSSRAGYPFVTVNCGAIPENLLESELFGYEKGAFTGASARKIGKFELAHQGSLFLDEVGELPLSLQVKLLRFLQEQEIERIGSSFSFKVDTRIIAATNRKLGEMVRNGTFREDLYYRLNVVTIDLPPLRERRADIPDLAQFFLARFCQQTGNDFSYISPEAMEKLFHYDWPGNVRQLQNVIHRSLVMASGNVILPEQLPELANDPLHHAADNKKLFVLQEQFQPGFTMRDVLHKIEAEVMKWALYQTSGNKAQAARMLEVSRKAFVYKCHEYQLDTIEEDV